MQSIASDAAPGKPQLSARQLVILVLWAVALWFAAAMFIRFAPVGYFGRGPATAILFAVALPVGWLGVRGTRRIARLDPDQLVEGVAVASAAAMLCDGIAFTWTTIYGPAERDLVPAAAWLLWGVALILVVSLIERWRARV